MFSTTEQLAKRTGRYGTPRFQYLQNLVTEFQDTDDTDAKEQVLANLANFAYDPYNFEALRKLNAIDLFLDHLDEPNKRLQEFAIGGICNCCVDPENAAIIIKNGGIPLIIKCLSSTEEETVISSIITLTFLLTPETKKDIATPAVVAAMQKYAAADNIRLKNVATVFLQQVTITR